MPFSHCPVFWTLASSVILGTNRICKICNKVSDCLLNSDRLVLLHLVAILGLICEERNVGLLTSLKLGHCQHIVINKHAGKVNFVEGFIRFIINYRQCRFY